jgi:hypothetical protein
MRSKLWAFSFATAILSGTMPSLARADATAIPPTVADVFARHEAAVGYSLSDGKAAPFIRYWSSTWKDEIGNPDSATSVDWQAGAFYRYEFTYLGSTSSIGFDGQKFWYGSTNDNVSEETGFARPYRVTASIVYAEAFDSSLNAKYLRSAPPDDIIRIQPPNGVTADVYFNKNTAFIDRVVYDPNGYAVLEQYRDYRAEGPVVVAHTVQYYDTISTLTKFEWNAQFDTTAVNPPTPHQYLWLPASGSTTVPFDNHGGVIIVGSVNGTDGHFLLDSSTDGIKLSKHFAKIGGLKLNENAKAQEAAPTVDSIDVGDMQMRDVHVAVINGNYSGPYDGILGSDVFAKTVVTIDFDKKLVTFQDPSSFHFDGARPSIALTFDDGLPQIPVTANGNATFPAGVSSGLMFLMTMSAGFMAAHPDIANSNGKYSSIGTIGELAIGPFKVPNVRVFPFEYARGYSNVPVAPAFLGMRVLSSFNMTFDYSDRLLFLTPD